MNANANDSIIHSPVANQKSGPFELPKLPYDKNALEPHMSSSTFDFHHEKHHQAYVTNLNKLITGTTYENQSLEQIIKSSKDLDTGIFNNAAQVWNHTFFWHSMKPAGGGKPKGKILEMIERDFQSFDNFKSEFKNAGATQFGSGWAWLVVDAGKLKITKTANADLPMNSNQKALLNCDVWEHAYYLDYQNKRPSYLEVFLDHLVNWDFAESNLT